MQTIHIRCQALFSMKKKKRKTHRNVFVISTLKIKPFLIYCTATVLKRINVREIAFYLEAHWQKYPLNLISMLKHKISLSIFTPSISISMLIFKNWMLKYPLLPLILELWYWEGQASANRVVATKFSIWSWSAVCYSFSSLNTSTWKYHIYPKYSDTSTPYHICSKIWTSTIHYRMLCLKIAGWVANSVDPDETPHSAASHLDLYCLLRPVCPNTYGKYGKMTC